MTGQQSVISEKLITTFFPKQFLASIQVAPTAPEAFSIAPAPVICHPTLANKLKIARAKLQPAHTPQMLKYLAYLRISCNLMQQMQGASLQSSSPQDSSPSYSQLVEALVAHDRNWWTHCTVSSIGCLRSSDTVVDHLFSTIEEFHQIWMTP
jgi:hypothetical protein